MTEEQREYTDEDNTFFDEMSAEYKKLNDRFIDRFDERTFMVYLLQEAMINALDFADSEEDFIKNEDAVKNCTLAFAPKREEK